MIMNNRMTVLEGEEEGGDERGDVLPVNAHGHQNEGSGSQRDNLNVQQHFTGDRSKYPLFVEHHE